MKRRTFLMGATAGLAGSRLAGNRLAAGAGRSANERFTICVAGVRGRGGSLLSTFAKQPDVDVKYVCDIDQSVLARGLSRAKQISGRDAEGIVDYRKALDDPSIDALVLGTPDHWHALPTIHACQAGKDVYVEKPDGHNVLEGRTMVAAARKHRRIVQLGTQARSGKMQAEAMAYLAEGNVGKVRFAKAWESSRQRSLGFPKDSAPPPGVDYDRWLGPAPKRPFNPVRFHGNWRWFFDYGTGDLGNDGVHRLDVARWALETALNAEGRQLATAPRAVSAHGGKHYFDDIQEWPDNLIATYDYGNCVLTYEMRIWTPYPLHGFSEGAAVLGDRGSVLIGNRGWKALDQGGKTVREADGNVPDNEHARNFLECIRSREKPNADLETVGHPSSLLCHLGNAAWRSGRTVHFDLDSYSFKDNDQANRELLTRPEYRKPWVLPDLASL